MRTIWLGVGMMLLALAACHKADTAEGDDGIMAAPADYTPAQKAFIAASFPAPYATADLVDGEKQFGKCRSCHTIAASQAVMVGPPLYGVFGRKSGTFPGYPYSDAMVAHNTVWDFDTLDIYLTSPQTVVKGTKMGFGGFHDDDKARRDLIAYLKLEDEVHALPAAGADSASASN